MDIWNKENIITTLKKGGIIVMPTDTIYGIVGRAEDAVAVDKIYRARKRNPSKPCVILIGDIEDLKKFSINLSIDQENKIREFWLIDFTQDKANAVSVVLDCPSKEFKYLHRDTNTLAFRLPKNENLRKLLSATGPLVAPSANIEGEPISNNIAEAQKYFKESVDLYVDGGNIKGTPSRVVKLHKDGSVSILRE